MQREIKFRGFSKRFRPNEWFYGDLVNYRSEKYILPEGQDVWDIIGDGVEVHSESVGQFTGLKDKNGKEIYEGDIVIEANANQEEMIRKEENIIGYITLSSRYGLCINKKSASFSSLINYCFDSDFDSKTLSNIEIIGNIHKNPELLK